MMEWSKHIEYGPEYQQETLHMGASNYWDTLSTEVINMDQNFVRKPRGGSPISDYLAVKQECALQNSRILLSKFYCFLVILTTICSHTY
jgi:hypothetical protein